MSSPSSTRQKPLQSYAITGAVILAILVIAAVSYAKSHAASEPYCQTHYQPFAYTVCQFQPTDKQAKLQLAWQYPANNALLLNFDNLAHQLNNTSQTLQFAMNAGMYDRNYAPIGYTVIHGKQIHSLNLKNGGGNFHLMPNGVFWWDKQGYHVTESQKMAELLDKGTQPLFATQSGPMLVIDGNIHPSFTADSTSLKLRNGVGVCEDGNVKFVISNTWVTFYQFAELYKTQLHCDNALFLDGGRASALYSRELKRQDNQYMGVMLAVTTAK